MFDSSENLVYAERFLGDNFGTFDSSPDSVQLAMALAQAIDLLLPGEWANRGPLFVGKAFTAFVEIHKTAWAKGTTNEIFITVGDKSVQIAIHDYPDYRSINLSMMIGQISKGDLRIVPVSK